MKREFDITENSGFSFFYKHTGLFTFWSGDWTIHLFPLSFQIGHREEWCHVLLESWGFGPLLLICKIG